MSSPAGQSSTDRGAAVQRTVYYSGRVQGVGFRFTTKMIAQRFPVSGFVRNLPDGRVELLAEGLPADLDRFQKAIHETMAEHIEGVEVSESPATGSHQGFSIAR